VEEGEVQIRQEVTFTVTLDHRFVDGAQAATLAQKMREVFADPEGHDLKEGSIRK
jgi:pyruvate/2-oxoglutarate dehydrogenase complex dihydrolipoamide acyltransferase (E2) component